MSQPTPYIRTYNFQELRASGPGGVFPANLVDVEFNNVKTTLDEILANLALIQRDDGELVIDIDSLEADVADLYSQLAALENDTRPAPTLDPLSFGAAGNGVTDDYVAFLAAWNASILTGIPLDGHGRTYAVTIPAGTLYFLQIATGMKAGNFTIKQLNFQSGGETRPIYANGKSDFHLYDIKIDRNGLPSDGTVNQYSFFIVGSHTFALDNIEVYGNGKGYGVHIHSSYNFRADDLLARDMAWQNGTDPGSEQIVGIRFTDCYDGLIRNPQAHRLYGQIGANPATAYQTDGIDCSGGARLTFVNPRCSYVWEGMDFSGSGINASIEIIGGVMYKIFAVGYKFTGAHRNNSVVGCIAQSCGLNGFAMNAGLAGTDGWTDVVFTNSHAIDTGDTEVSGSYWAGNTFQAIAWAVENGATAALTCKNVRAIGCSAIDNQAVPTMRRAWLVQNLPTEEGRPQLTNWRSSGSTVGEFLTTNASFPAPLVDGYLPSGSQTYDLVSLADGVGVTTAGITAIGARFGDTVEVSLGIDMQGIRVFGWVSASDTIKVRFENESGGTLDIASATLTYRVRKILH